MSNDDANKTVSRRQIARLIGSSSVPMYVLDEQDIVVFANESLAVELQTSVDGLIGLNTSFFERDETLADVSELQTSQNRLQRELGAPVGWNRREFLISPMSKDRVRLWVPLDKVSDDAKIGTDRCTVLVLILPSSLESILKQVDLQYDLNTEAILSKPLLAPTERLQDVFWFAAGGSIKAERFRQQVMAALATDHSFVITGPNTQEREELAKGIHQSRIALRDSPFAPGSLIRVDCHLLDATLLDNVLEAIDETLVSFPKKTALLLAGLDELPDELSTSLDRYLSQHPELRIVSTTSADDWPATRQGANKSRIWLRVSHQTIELPDVRERMEDLDAMIDAWFMLRQRKMMSDLRDYSRKIATHYSMATEAKEALYAYSWPGSYTELNNALLKGWQEAAGGVVQCAHLPASIRTFPGHLEKPISLEPIHLDSILESVERKLIENALEVSGGNRSAASKLLGISRARLIRRLQQWGLANETGSIADAGDSSMFEEIDES